jgi:SMC interacting uncharacterized protein involved in chromosome segregation
MMDNETLQVLIGHLRELKAGQEELKMEMNAVYAGQEGLKSEISAVKYDIENSISALKDEISAVKNELRQEISTFQEGIRADQAEFEERVTCTVDAQWRNMSSMVEQQPRDLREDLSRNIEATRQDIEAT